MALSFAAGTMALNSWGFGVADIANLAGAGRKAVTWIIAQTKDRDLLNFLGIDIDGVFSRKGIVDLVALHQRWDVKLRLLQNNKPVNIVHPAGSNKAVVENMDRFTWILTIIVAALHGCVSIPALHRIVSKFLEDVFRESPTGMEYLRRELSQHIQGWVSCGCVRDMLHHASTSWSRLEKDGLHWPGFIPRNDEAEIHEFLVWLVAGDSQGYTFRTGSSDVFCFAAVMEELGMGIHAARDEAEVEAYRLSVVLSQDPMVRRHNDRGADERWGMRIPLLGMEECLSLWPGDQALRNDLRQIFADGMYHLRKDDAHAVFTHTHGRPFYRVETGYTTQERRRLEGIEARAGRYFLPNHLYQTAKYFNTLLSHWLEPDRLKFEQQLCDDPDAERVEAFRDVLSVTAFAKLQAFLMGCYYGLLAPLLNTEHLTTKEAFGCWTYCDVEFLQRIALLLRRSRQHQAVAGEWTSFPRADVLGLVAYLFAGVKHSEISQATSSAAIGVLGKLSVITGSCLGVVDTFNGCGRLALLDVDTSFIPCNSKGIVVEGLSPALHVSEVIPRSSSTTELDTVSLHTQTADFTVHLEPDWDNDISTSLISFRHNGRLVCRLAPSTVEAALSGVELNGVPFQTAARDEYLASLDQSEASAALGLWFQHEVVSRVRSVIEVPLSSFHGGRIAKAEDDDVAILVPTSGLPKARACVLAMYQMHLRNSSAWRDTAEFTQVSSAQELVHALGRNARYVVGTERTVSVLQLGSRSRALDTRAISARHNVEAELVDSWRTERYIASKFDIDEERAKKKPVQKPRKMSL